MAEHVLRFEYAEEEALLRTLLKRFIRSSESAGPTAAVASRLLERLEEIYTINIEATLPGRDEWGIATMECRDVRDLRGWRVRWYSGPDAEEEARAAFEYMTKMWRDEMRERARRNDVEIAAGRAHTNADSYAWNNSVDGVKYRRWAILRREVTTAVEVELFEGEPVAV